MLPANARGFFFGNKPQNDATTGLEEYLIRRDLPHYIYVNDLTHPERDAFVSALVGEVRKFPFQDDGTFAISRANADFPLLFIDVNDPVRAARYLRNHRALLNNIATFAIMAHSSPARRARLLAAGCDDVFDCARMTLQEAGLRIEAVLRRRAMSAINPQWSKPLPQVAALCDPAQLTPRERSLLAVLAQHEGEAISVGVLLRQVDHADPARFRRSLKVSISNLRKKLPAPYGIEAVPGGGYRLVREEELPPVRAQDPESDDLGVG